MSYIPYVPNMEVWNNVKNIRSIKDFYPLQDGKGSSIQLISPAEGSVQRAKLDLKRQLQGVEDHSGLRKRRRSTTPRVVKKKPKPKKKSKPKKKTTTKSKKKA